MTPGRPIYLDHHATTPCDPRVVEAMMPWWTERFGNAASTTHVYGREAARAVEEARAEVAALVGADPREIVFTSGATEALNLALKGLAAGRPGGGGPGREAGPARVVASASEHTAVLDVLKGPAFAPELVAPTPGGIVEPDAIAAALARAPALAVAVMAANNEVGTVQPVSAIAEVARAAGAFMVCDAAQVAGKLPFDVRALGVDLAAISAHKLNGPKGVGALIVRRRRGEAPLPLAPLIEGGGHERGLRSGTLPVPLIVGFGAAARLARGALVEEAIRVAALRDRLWAGLRAGLGERVVRTGGEGAPRLPGNLHVALPGIEARRLLERMPELALSAGSACTSADLSPSHVLVAMGLSDRHVYGSLRFGVGRGTTEAEIDRAIAVLVAAVERIGE
ncbi:MAG: cysteine desulfurase [Deltaproteobacteria bacterium]|nr:cysteine desulfurase [Deltaproteobacteria bacterium]